MAAVGTDGPGEREITVPVDLCLPDGRLSPSAVGWTRRPLHRANLRGWGRTKRWEYWCVTTPTHLVALTVSDLDFLTLHSVHVLCFGPEAVAAAAAAAGAEAGAGTWELERTALIPFGRGVRLPEGIAGAAPGADVTAGPERPGRAGQVRVEILAESGGTRLRGRCVAPDGRPVEVDLLVSPDPGHETLGVVVPWSERRFQYTCKGTALPARGTLRIGDHELPFGGGAGKGEAGSGEPGSGQEAWAVLDHGRGRWPRSIRWNWAAASGRTGGHVVGLQFGGRWTEGTGTTENALCVDGRLTKIGEELDWRYDPERPLSPWRLRTRSSDQVDLSFTPFHDRRVRTQAGVLANRTDQCFGHWTGLVRTAEGEEVAVDGLLGWAEDVAMRW